MKNNGVTKEFYISQSGIKGGFYPRLFLGSSLDRPKTIPR